jgi:hypothetical protein
MQHICQSGRNRDANPEQHHLKSGLAELIGMFAVQ